MILIMYPYHRFSRLADRYRFYGFACLIAIGVLVMVSYIGLNINRSSEASTRSQNIVELHNTNSTATKPSTQDTIGDINQPNNVGPSVKILFGGDVMLADTMTSLIVNSKLNPLEKMISKFDQYDLVVVNLETNISKTATGAKANKNYTFKAPPEVIPVLAESGVDMVSLANNHTMDFGPAALAEQISLLTDSGVIPFGAGANAAEAFSPKYTVVNGTVIAMIGVNNVETLIGNARSDRAGSAYFNESLVRSTIRDAKAKADIVIVFPHWGVEHQLEANAKQQQWGRLFIDSGADLVVGAHPHVRQNVETYKGKQIVYSLGNFVFTGMNWNPEAMKGSILEVIIQDKKLVSTKLETVQLSPEGFPAIIN